MIILLQTPVTVDMLWRDEDETGTVNCGENVKVKLRGVEEADVAPGFVLCDPSNPCKTGRIFDAQVRFLSASVWSLFLLVFAVL